MRASGIDPYGLRPSSSSAKRGQEESEGNNSLEGKNKKVRTEEAAEVGDTSANLSYGDFRA